MQVQYYQTLLFHYSKLYNLHAFYKHIFYIWKTVPFARFELLILYFESQASRNKPQVRTQLKTALYQVDKFQGQHLFKFRLKYMCI